MFAVLVSAYTYTAQFYFVLYVLKCTPSYLYTSLSSNLDSNHVYVRSCECHLFFLSSTLYYNLLDYILLLLHADPLSHETR